ncbi:MAG: thymidine kinase [Oligoflexia bacterium]|nr:thymidine kinase [Oligoflexia bacterium]
MRETVGSYGWVEVICGCMFSGKTEELIRRMTRAQIARQKLQVFKPAIDDRYGKECVSSHNANRIDSIPIHGAAEILERLDDSTRVVGIDEAQFFDTHLVEVVERLAMRGIRVVIAGLDMDFRGEPFGPMPQLLAIAEQVTKLTAVCMVCGGPATRSQRMISSDETVLVGAHDSYEARCRAHHHSQAENRALLRPVMKASLEGSIGISQ